MDGNGRVLVTGVGERCHSVAATHRPPATTPLHALLLQLAGAIGKMGVLVAGGCFVVLTVRCGGRCVVKGRVKSATTHSMGYLLWEHCMMRRLYRGCMLQPTISKPITTHDSAASRNHRPTPQRMHPQQQPGGASSKGASHLPACQRAPFIFLWQP